MNVTQGPVPLVTLRSDVEALAGLVRDSAGPGERAAADYVARRLRESGVDDVALETFRYQGTYAWAHALHALAGARGGIAALAALVSLELEASGRSQWLRRLLPAGEGTNVVARVGAGDHTVVVVAHTDAARTGLAWHPLLMEAGAARRLRRRSVDPFMAPTGAALALCALPWRAPRLLGRALLALSIAADIDIATSPTVPGASDNATGVAAALALAADPPPGVELLLVFPGCEESGMGGMASFLRMHQLDPARTLVLGLDTLGAGTPIVCRAEGTLRAHQYALEDLDLADTGADRAGLPAPERWRIGGWTDPILARFAGLRAISLLSRGPQGMFTNYHRMTDTPERVDWDSVERCVAIARGTTEAFRETGSDSFQQVRFSGR